MPAKSNSPKTQRDFALQAGLVYVSNHIPGITRVKSGKGYSYYSPDNKLITDIAEKKRINSLAIPPAYTNVWISPIRNSHLQATSKDSKGRTQYKYHTDWSTYKNYINHMRMLEFGKALPQIRKTIHKDIFCENIDLHKRQVLGTIVSLLDITLIRIGNEEYAKKNESFGLTTLHKKHVDLKPKTSLIFEFKGKSHKEHRVEIHNKKLFEIVAKSMEIPGYELFKYIDYKGVKHDITSTHVNKYIQEITGEKFTAKDFRTWWATVLTLQKLKENSESNFKRKTITEAIKFTSSKLGNTPTVCKKYYIYQGVIDAFQENTLLSYLQDFKSKNSSYLQSIEQETEYFLQLHTSNSDKKRT
jgi:DNA topoisomerase I